jgi:hypothetical protein
MAVDSIAVTMKANDDDDYLILLWFEWATT